MDYPSTVKYEHFSLSFISICSLPYHVSGEACDMLGELPQGQKILCRNPLPNFPLSGSNTKARGMNSLDGVRWLTVPGKKEEHLPSRSEARM